MNRAEFISELRMIADDIERGHFHIADFGKNTIFANKHYGEVWVKINENCTISVDLFNEDDEEKEKIK